MRSPCHSRIVHLVIRRLTTPKVLDSVCLTSYASSSIPYDWKSFCLFSHLHRFIDYPFSCRPGNAIFFSLVVGSFLSLIVFCYFAAFIGHFDLLGFKGLACIFPETRNSLLHLLRVGFSNPFLSRFSTGNLDIRLTDSILNTPPVNGLKLLPNLVFAQGIAAFQRVDKGLLLISHECSRILTTVSIGILRLPVRRLFNSLSPFGRRIFQDLIIPVGGAGQAGALYHRSRFRERVGFLKTALRLFLPAFSLGKRTLDALKGLFLLLVSQRAFGIQGMLNRPVQAVAKLLRQTRMLRFFYRVSVLCIHGAIHGKSWFQSQSFADHSGINSALHHGFKGFFIGYLMLLGKFMGDIQGLSPVLRLSHALCLAKAFRNTVSFGVLPGIAGQLVNPLADLLGSHAAVIVGGLERTLGGIGERS